MENSKDCEIKQPWVLATPATAAEAANQGSQGSPGPPVVALTSHRFPAQGFSRLLPGSVIDFTNPDPASLLTTIYHHDECRIYLPSHTLYSVRKIEGSSTMASIYSPIAPVTPDKSSKAQDCVPPKVAEAVNQEAEEKREISEQTSSQKLKSEKNAEKEEQDVGLGKTPRQKPRRKKIRPKVIREEKRAKTPRPATPKPLAPKPARNGELRIKRKYVRRKFSTETSNTPDQQDTVAAKNNKNRVKRKYVRKKLSKEVSEAPHDSVTAKNTADQQEKNRTNSVNPVKRKYVQRKRRQRRSDSPSDTASENEKRTPAKLNESRTSFRNCDKRKQGRKRPLGDLHFLPDEAGKSVSLHDSSEPREIPPTPGVYRSKSVRRSLHFDLEDHRTSGNIGLMINNTEFQAQGACNNAISQSTSLSMEQFNQGFEGEDIPPGFAYNLNRSASKMLEEYIELPEEESPPSQFSVAESIKDNSGDLMEEINYSSSIVDPYSFMQSKVENAKMKGCTNDASGMLLEGNIIQENGAKWALATDAQYHKTNSYDPFFPVIHKKRRTEKGLKVYAANSWQTSSAFRVYTVADMEKMIFEQSQDDGYILRLNPLEVKTKKRSKTPIRARNSHSLATIAEAMSGDIWTENKTKRLYAGRLQENNLHPVQIDYIYGTESCSSFQKQLTVTAMSQAIVSYMDHMEEITLKLKYLCLDERSHAQRELALYAGGTMMVPIKLRPRAKVDLDDETNRVWKILMGKQRIYEPNNQNVNRDKWWEEERRVFHGRADSFIARMHLVQGDRRFSQWKGSVVDSVVGVFLTQNVSDHLSSSAFMALAARFPLKSRNRNAEELSKCLNLQYGCIQPFANMRWHGKIAILEVSSSVGIQEVDNAEETASSKETARGTTEDHMEDSSKDSSEVHEIGIEIDPATPTGQTGSTLTVAGCNSSAEAEDRSAGDVISFQASVVPKEKSLEKLMQMDTEKISSMLNTGTKAMVGTKCNCLENSSPMAILQITDITEVHRCCMQNTKSLPSTEQCGQVDEAAQKGIEGVLKPSQADDPKEKHISSYRFEINPYHDCGDIQCRPSASCNIPEKTEPGLTETKCGKELGEEGKPHLPSLDSAIKNPIYISTTEESTAGTTTEQHLPLVSNISPVIDSHTSKFNQSYQPGTFSEVEDCFGKQPSSHFSEKNAEPTFGKTTMVEISQLNAELKAKCLQEERKEDLRVVDNQHKIETQSGEEHCKMPQTCANSCKNRRVNLDIAKKVESNLKDKNHSSPKVSLETAKKSSAEKRAKAKNKTNKNFNWDSLRKQAISSREKKERSWNGMNSVDWDAVRLAEVNEIALTIRERGMNNVLAERIKGFLNRLVGDHGSIDLEWLRDIEPDRAKDYLLSIRGLGLKSVECVRLLTLQQLAFPVDTNVGRICVRLGWVPLQPLPESLQLHLLELYPVLETIQKYLWPRLCTLDQRTLYELHYQMITFGKVFCTKSKPNCNACPMRGECKHFASAFASARLPLPGPEDKSLVSSKIFTLPGNDQSQSLNSRTLPQLESQQLLEKPASNNHEPIIEEPATPEPEHSETLQSEIEESFYEDPDEIPTIKLNLKEFKQNLQDLMRANNIEFQDGDLSKALVAVSPENASIPMPKLKNVSRLRTEHQVYELPDAHPLLEKMDHREHDDPSPYLLAIWTPGETAVSTEPPKICCNSQHTGKLCHEEGCFACNSIREAKAQNVRGTLLIPCRTAMRGSFPLNGTYFQVNEVFADHDSSCNPIDVPRGWIWNLPRRIVYFGTSVTTIFKGLTTEEIQQCFWRGFVCVRGFDRTTRAPRPLYARLHFPASKRPRTQRRPENEE